MGHQRGAGLARACGGRSLPRGPVAPPVSPPPKPNDQHEQRSGERQCDYGMISYPIHASGRCTSRRGADIDDGVPA
jgi:hypothetical protein